MRLQRHLSFSTKVTLGLSVGLCFLLVLGALGGYSIAEFYDTGREVRRLLEVRTRLETVRRHVDQAEVAQLRFQLTVEAGEAEAFRRMMIEVSRDLEELRAKLLIPDQIARFDQLREAVHARFGVLGEAMRKRAAGTAATGVLFGERGNSVGREVDRLIDAIAQRQQQLVRANAEKVEYLVSALVKLSILGCGVAVALLVWTILIINRNERDRQRAEVDLANARERLNDALEGSTSAAWDWNLRRDEIYLSAGWAQIVGTSGGETTVKPEQLLALVHPEDLVAVQNALRDALAGATPDYRIEHRVRRADGTWVWILSRGKVVRRDSAGYAERVTGTNQDVSERKAIELALKEHDDRLQLALAAAGMVRWDWNVEKDEFVWPDSPARLVGPEPRSGYSALPDLVHPEDLPHFFKTLQRTVQTGEPYKDEYRLARTDGKLVSVAASGYVARDDLGHTVRLVGVAQDISDIKQAEAALRASERELRLITDSVPALIGYVDAEQTLRFCNRALAAFAGARVEQLVGTPLRELFGDDVYGVIAPYAQRALAGERVQFQRSQKKSGGGIVDLDVSYIPRRGALGEVEGFYSLLTDITELKRLDRMKSEFVSTVSHELRTPLTSIRGSLGILAGGVAGPLSDKVRGFIDIAKDNCERLIRLINDILDMEKIESGKMTFKLEALELMPLIKRAIEANEGFAAQHSVRLQLVSELPDTKVQGDADRLAQVLTNLISNACKFSPAGASVDVSASSDGERVRVAVIDHGPGIAAEFRQRIFQKFSQEDSSSVRQKGGTGLGLSISKAIVEGLGGGIGFDSEIGRGSSFYFHLPRWREATNPGAQGEGICTQN